MGVTLAFDTTFARRRRFKHMGATMAFDSSYPAGGEAVSLANYFIGQTWGGMTIESKNGYFFEPDVANQKVKVFGPAPPIVYEEAHTIASNAVTLDYPAAAILQVCSASQGQMLVEPSATMAANECQLAAAMAAGVRTEIDFHGSTSGVVYVTYITQAWHDVWVNRQASVAVTASTEVCDLDDTACFIESCLMAGVTGENFPQYVRGGDGADASDECEVDWTDSGAAVAGDTTLTFNDTATGCIVTYIRLPATGFLQDHFIEDFDLTMSSGVSAAQCPIRPILFTSLCGQIPDYHAAAERDPHILGMPMFDALGTGAEFYINWHTRPGVGITGHINTNDSTSDALSFTGVCGTIDEIPGLVPLEVRNGTDLSGLTGVRFLAWKD